MTVLQFLQAHHSLNSFVTSMKNWKTQNGSTQRYLQQQ
jgi:hypothetical protein